MGYTLGGTAVNGSDYSAVSNFVVIPTGAASATVAVSPVDDGLAEGTETVSVSVANSSHYNAGLGTNANLTIADNEAAPPGLAVGLTLPAAGQYALTVKGTATRVVDIESSSNLFSWQPLATMINAGGTNRLYEAIQNSASFFFRARQGP